jgi:hypothetical protein
MSSGFIQALLVGGVILAAALPAAASIEGKQLRIERLETVPRIDGRLDEAVWEQATRIDDLHQVEPLEFAPAGERTEIRVYYTRDALYVSARMYQDPARITANIQKQGADDKIWDDDWFGFDVDPWNAQRSGYFFIVNPNGVRWDGAFKNISGLDHDWAGIWQAAARRDEQGWTAEFELPFSALSFNPDTDTWGFNFERRVARTNEYIAWSSRGQQVNPSTNGAARGFAGLEQGLGLSVMPSAVARTTRMHGLDAREETRFDPSLDVSYRITPELTATLTANTDFSATDVDARQVNLSRFSLFFPEKREFFLRDADIFEFGHLDDNGRPFFSRRIGLNRNGRPIDIDYGAKLSGHFGSFDLGSLYIRQGADPDTGIGARDILVTRGSAHLFSESSVGLILTSGDPQSELDNTLMGADFSLRNSRLEGGRELRFDGWFQRSDQEGLEGRNDAWGLALTTLKPAGWYGSAAYKQIGENFAPALGFVNRAGIEDLTSKGGYKWRFGRGNFFQLIDVGADYYRADALADGRLGSSLGDLRVNATTQRGDGLGLAVYDARERLDEDFTIYAATDGSRSVVIPAGEYAFTEAELTLRAQDQISLPGGDFTVRLMTLGATVAFDAHWSWTSLAQYDNVSEVLGLNSRLHWTPRAGRNAWLVVNLGREDRDRDRRFRAISEEIALKYSHDLRY